MFCKKFEVVKISKDFKSSKDIIYILLKCIDKNSKFNQGNYFVLRTYPYIIKELEKWFIRDNKNKERIILDINYIQSEHIKEIIELYTYPIYTWCLEKLKKDLKNGKFDFKKIICKDKISICYYSKKCYEKYFLHHYNI